jgi:hypothetical protein
MDSNLRSMQSNQTFTKTLNSKMYKRADYDQAARLRKAAFVQIGKKLGKNHPITKMMGSLAWRRHNAEQGVDGNLRTAIREYSFLDGYFDALNLWARDNDTKAQRIMLDIFPRGMRHKPTDET